MARSNVLGLDVWTRFFGLRLSGIGVLGRICQNSEN